MNTTKTTAKIWSINTMYDGEVLIQDGQDTDICKVFIPYPQEGDDTSGEGCLKRQAANARLIAAAPELLSALKIAIAYIYGSKAKSGVQISSVKADLDICMSAISKATGGAS